jgi:hypothetical protein
MLDVVYAGKKSEGAQEELWQSESLAIKSAGNLCSMAKKSLSLSGKDTHVQILSKYPKS